MVFNVFHMNIYNAMHIFCAILKDNCMKIIFKHLFQVAKKELEQISRGESIHAYRVHITRKNRFPLPVASPLLCSACPKVISLNKFSHIYVSPVLLKVVMVCFLNPELAYPFLIIQNIISVNVVQLISINIILFVAFFVW